MNWHLRVLRRSHGAGTVWRSLALAMMSVVVLLAGCAEQRIRKQSQSHIGGGKFDRAIEVLSDGLKQHPESVSLRSALLQAQSAALTNKVDSAAELRSVGKLDEAELELQRAKSLDPTNARVDALIREVIRDRRQAAALIEAEQWMLKKRPDMALRVVEQALKDNPRHSKLVALQRRLASDQRQAQVHAAQKFLVESRPISLDFRDASLRTVLDVVSRNSGVNFILDKDIRNDVRVTVFLRQARVEDALDLINSTNQLAMKVIDTKTIVIYPNSPEKQREYQEQIVRVFYLASADAKGAAAFLKSMLKIREPFVDERSNMLALRDSHEHIQLAERLITLFDTSEPEVMLEVEVLEVASTRLTELGVRFPNSFSLTPLAPDGSTDLTLGNIRGLNRDRLALGLGGITVNLRREVGDFTTLANPKIRTRSKQKAKILIGDKIPVVTATTGLAGFVADSVSYLDVGLKLDVEPTVYADDDVSISVALEVSSLGTAVKTSSGTLAYQISTRNASTLLRLHDGETQILAGLISREDRTSASRLPGLGDVPMLGRLFSDQSDNSKRTELVLAITPRILRNLARPDASEGELWIGTEAWPRLRPPGGTPVDAMVDDQPNDPSKSSSAPPDRPGESELDPRGTGRRAAAGPQFMWSGPTDAVVGSIVEYELSLSTVEPLRGVPTEILFNKDKLQLIDVAEGEFFRQGGAATSFSKGTDGKDGKVNSGVLRNEGTGAAGQGTVLSLRFKAIASGAAQLRLVSAPAIALGRAVAPSSLPPPSRLQIK